MTNKPKFSQGAIVQTKTGGPTKMMVMASAFGASPHYNGYSGYGRIYECRYFDGSEFKTAKFEEFELEDVLV